MISIIVAVYNVEKYIENTLKSIVNQDYADFELVIVDDGSTDKSVEVINEFLNRKNINWKLIKKENGGQSSSRNVGLRNASGEYIVFMDSDDVIAGDFLSKLKDALDKNDCEFSFCNFDFVKQQIPPKDTDLRVKRYEKKELLNVFLRRSINFVLPSMMFKKEFLLKNKLLFDERIRFSEDQMFIWNVIIQSKNSVYLYNKMYGYYVREKSIMTASPYNKIMNGHEIYRDFCENLNNNYPMYHDVIKYILPRWQIGTLYSSAKLVSYEEYYDLYKRFDGNTIFNRLIGLGEIKAYLLSFVAKSPRLLNKLCKVMNLNA